MIKTTLPGKLGAIDTEGVFTSVSAMVAFKVIITDHYGNEVFVGHADRGIVYLPEMQPDWKLTVENKSSETGEFYLNSNVKK